MADKVTLPFGIQSEYDRLVMRGGPTIQLTQARAYIAHMLSLNPHRFEELTTPAYQRMDGHAAMTDDTTEEEFYNGAS